EEAEFIKKSVEHSSSAGWVDRFRAVVDRATEVTHLATGPLTSGIVFEYANRLSLGAAAQKAKELDTELLVLAVWDGRDHDRRGGTVDMLRMAALAGTPIEVISPEAEFAPPSPYQLSSSPSSDESSDDIILHALCFSLALEDEVATADSIAAVLADHRPLAAEVYDRRYRLFFESPESAAVAAIDILSAVGLRLDHSIGLHSFPVTKRLHPVT